MVDPSAKAVVEAPRAVTKKQSLAACDKLGSEVDKPGRISVKPPKQILDDADLLAYAAVPASSRFTGRLHLYHGGEPVGPVPYLAICRPHDPLGLFLVHCDESWDIVGLQAWNGPGVEPILTIEEMKSRAEVFYEGLMESNLTGPEFL